MEGVGGLGVPLPVDRLGAGSCSGTAVESNSRYRQLISRGATDLRVVFDLPTRWGHDSDSPHSRGEVGRAGVAVDSLDDMRVLFHGIPLEKVSTSMTIDAPAAPLLLLYHLVAEEQGIPARQLTGTLHSDVLKEHIVQGTSLFRPRSSLRLTSDLLRYCRAELPGWNALSISGSPLAEAGASPAQEIAFTLADGIEYVRAAVAAGIDIDGLVPRPSFSFAARTTRATTLDEVAKFRAAHRTWARVMRDGFGVRSTGAVMPYVRTPACGTDVTAPLDARLLERTTDDMEAAATGLMAEVAALGGAAVAVELGFQRREMGRDACAPGHRFRADEGEPYTSVCVDPAVEARQVERLAKLRAWRCHERVGTAVLALRKAAEGDDNVLYPMKDALAAGATVGEVCDALRGVWDTDNLLDDCHRVSDTKG
ncbi:methylmalonyl-CoA mutase family protein [Streptomyces sp. NPDC005538]|uniref:methylmalonyl-CoA mutase family protein n=1 Tax=unclassified Streptomyces TaxID=2593676 RepID=UPI0033AEADBB